MSRQHDWEIASIFGSSAGLIEYWQCFTCGTCGGVTKGDLEPGTLGRFLVGTTLIDLPDDCEEASRIIDEYATKYPDYAARVRDERTKNR